MGGGCSTLNIDEEVLKYMGIWECRHCGARAEYRHWHGDNYMKDFWLCDTCCKFLADRMLLQYDLVDKQTRV
jgi:ribosomal protein L37AE/L43A